MTAALGTLPFLATLWLLVVLGASALEESGAKIAAALKGRLAAHPSGLPPARTRPRTWVKTGYARPRDMARRRLTFA
jgi:hypothetical protein